MLSAIHLLLVALTIAVTSARPALQTSSPQMTDFYLVTTSQHAPHGAKHNSSHLANVSATSLFDPFNQMPYLLRQIGPGYNSLPTFNLTDGTLHSLAYGIEASGPYVYNSTSTKEGEDLTFLPEKEGKGELALVNGYLLTHGGHGEGWTICPGDLGEQVVSLSVMLDVSTPF